MLLEGAPDWLDRDAMQEQLIAAVPGVSGIHHVHVWGLTPQQLMLTMHMSLTDDAGNQTELIRSAKQFLKKEYGIGHTTIEVDADGCSDH